MPGARCTRSRAWCVESTRVSHHEVAEHNDIVAAMVTPARDRRYWFKFSGKF
jgi:hypothetical protein